MLTPLPAVHGGFFTAKEPLRTKRLHEKAPSPAGLDAESNGSVDGRVGPASRVKPSAQAKPSSGGPLPPHRAQKPGGTHLQPTRVARVSGTSSPHRGSIYTLQPRTEGPQTCPHQGLLYRRSAKLLTPSLTPLPCVRTRLPLSSPPPPPLNSSPPAMQGLIPQDPSPAGHTSPSSATTCPVSAGSF